MNFVQNLLLLRIFFFSCMNHGRYQRIIFILAVKYGHLLLGIVKTGICIYIHRDGKATDQSLVVVLPFTLTLTLTLTLILTPVPRTLASAAPNLNQAT